MPVHLHHACEVLGVHPIDPDLGGSARRSFRQLVKTAHPDKGGDTERFTAITDAYRAIQDWIDNPQPMPAFHGFPADWHVVHAPPGTEVHQTVTDGHVTFTINFKF